MPNIDLLDGLKTSYYKGFYMQSFVQVMTDSYELEWAKTSTKRPCCATSEARRGHGRYEPKGGIWAKHRRVEWPTDLWWWSFSHARFPSDHSPLP